MDRESAGRRPGQRAVPAGECNGSSFSSMMTMKCQCDRITAFYLGRFAHRDVNLDSMIIGNAVPRLA